MPASVFIAWSDDRSKVIALALKRRIRTVLQGTEVFVSDVDIAAGKRWFDHLMSRLSGSTFGILALTRDNLTKPWLHFETGVMLAALKEDRRVAPFLVDDIPVSQMAGILPQLQAKKADRDGTLALVRSIREVGNYAIPDEVFEQSFADAWPDLAKEIETVRNAPKPGVAKPRRPTDEILEQILEGVGRLDRLLSGGATPSLSQFDAQAWDFPEALVASRSMERSGTRVLADIQELLDDGRLYAEERDMLAEMRNQLYRHLVDLLRKGVDLDTMKLGGLVILRAEGAVAHIKARVAAASSRSLERSEQPPPQAQPGVDANNPA